MATVPNTSAGPGAPGASQPDPGVGAPLSGLPGGAPQAVQDAANGKQLDGTGERSALDWLCGAPAPIPFSSVVQLDTPDGRKDLQFNMIQLDSAELDAIEKRNRTGDGPFSTLNTRTYNAEVVSVATTEIVDLASGEKVKPTDPQFIGPFIAPPIAMEKRFAFQSGLLRGLVDQIREMAGNSDDRVGTAQRILVDAAGNS